MTNKIWILGFHSFLPLVFVFVFVGSDIEIVTIGMWFEKGLPIAKVYAIVTLYTLLTGLFLFIYYIQHAARSRSLPLIKKIGWIAFIVYGNFIAFPLYFWFNIRCSDS